MVLTADHGGQDLPERARLKGVKDAQRVDPQLTAATIGKQVGAKHTFATNTNARRWLSSVETDLARGDNFDESAGSVRFGDYALHWLDERPLRPRTREMYESQLRKRILPTFETVTVEPFTVTSPPFVRPPVPTCPVSIKKTWTFSLTGVR